MKRQHYLPFILAAIIVLILSSCITEKKRAKICQACALKTEVKDSIVERLIEVTVYTPPTTGPTLYLPSPCASLCDSLGNLKPFQIEKKHNGIKTTVKTNTATNTLDISSNLEDSLKHTAKVTSKEVYRTKTEQFAPRCELRHVTSWLIFCQWFTIICFICAGIYLFIRLR